MSKLLALLDLLSRLLDLVAGMVKRAKRREREQRNEEIDSDPAGEFADHFGGVRDDEREPVPGDETNIEPREDRGQRDRPES